VSATRRVLKNIRKAKVLSICWSAWGRKRGMSPAGIGGRLNDVSGKGICHLGPRPCGNFIFVAERQVTGKWIEFGRSSLR
jgi:hypothetical protein